MPMYSRVLDYGLVSLADASHMVVTELEPSNYSLASIGAANCLGFKDLGVGNVFGPISDHSVNGRYVSSTAFTGGTLTTTGTVAYYAAIDSTNGRVLVSQTMSNPQAVTAGNSFSLASVSIRIPSTE